MRKFRELLDEYHTWPCDYQFKFVVPVERQRDVESLVTGASVAVRPSSKGKYVSVTLTANVKSADAVIAVHEQASKIDGLIAL